MEVTQIQRYQVFFYAPASHADSVKQAMFDAGAGQLGDYSQCCWQTEGLGQYLPHESADPFLGKKNKLCKEPEYKVEMLCLADCLQDVVKALKTAHPYEEPAYGVTTLENI